jgi:CDP-diacylglycerol--serine O-phosphatidyltransferase
VRGGRSVTSVRAALPSLVTAVTLSCGLASLEATRLNAWDWTLRLILLAAIADGIDGALARHLQSTSPMGEQLDSLADIVAFGAAPAFLLATHLATLNEPLRFGVALAFVLAGAYRLARFHAQPLDNVFCGLPITAAGSLLTLAVAGPLGLDTTALVSVAIALTVLMVCRHQFPKVARSSRSGVLLLVLAALPLLVWPRIETLAVLGIISFGAYVIWGLAGRSAVGLIEKILHGGADGRQGRPVRPA